MRVEKIKEILKSKRTLIISTVLVGAVAVVTAGTMILHNKNIENNNVAIEKNIEDKVSEDDILEEINEELEVENTVESTEEHVHDENCNHDEENSTSQENNQVVEQNNNSSTNKQEETNKNNSDKKVSTTTQTNVNNSNKSDTTSNSNSNSNININKNEHTHSWVEVYKDVYHAEEGHWENVLVKDAWTETVPIYETKIVNICNGCGKDITGFENDHTEEQALIGNYACGGWHNEQRKVQTGTNTINHDAVYEKKWVVDKAAWTEKVLSGYKCSSCGATK